MKNFLGLLRLKIQKKNINALYRKNSPLNVIGINLGKN